MQNAIDLFYDKVVKKIFIFSLFISFFLLLASFVFIRPAPMQAYGEASQYCPKAGGTGSTFCGTSWCDGAYNCTYHSWSCTGTSGNVCVTPAYSHPYSDSCSGSRGSTYCSSKKPWLCNTSTGTCSQSVSGTLTKSGCDTTCTTSAPTNMCPSGFECGIYVNNTGQTFQCGSCGNSTLNCVNNKCIAPPPSINLPPSCNPANGVATIDCIPPLIATLIYWLVLLVGTIAVIFIIIGGIRFILSGGDPKKLDQAKKTITFAVLGLILVFLSFFIVNFIAETTGIGCINTSMPFSFGVCAN